jgi:hypothetical protein
VARPCKVWRRPLRPVPAEPSQAASRSSGSRPARGLPRDDGVRVRVGARNTACKLSGLSVRELRSVTFDVNAVEQEIDEFQVQGLELDWA